MWQRFYIVIITNTFFSVTKVFKCFCIHKTFLAITHWFKKYVPAKNYLLVLHSFISVHVINTLQYFQINQIKTNNIFNTSQTILSFFCFLFFVCAKKLWDYWRTVERFFQSKDGFCSWEVVFRGPPENVHLLR